MKKQTLLQVEKPARYIGGESGTVKKNNPDIRFILAFPDVYEVGMSHLGSQVLYTALNNIEWVSAERAYAPWPDMDRMLEETGACLASLESNTPLQDADIVGFTLQYELSYTNILHMMKRSNIPLLATERTAESPLILGGGPCAYNPEPLADFFDAFLLGDGEEAVASICETVRKWKLAHGTRQELLRQLSRIEGIYIPSLFAVEHGPDGSIAAISPQQAGYEKVRRAFLVDLENASCPTAPIVPFLKTVHDRVSLEIARGCSRGCRFCQAGYIYRPVRERSPAKILELADKSLKATGYDEISLLSLSTGDYSCIAPLLSALMARYADSRIAVSFPSLRVGTLTGELIEEIKKVRKTGFTLAPEAGSERLRRAINKGITEEDLLANAYEAYRNGWRLIKLYFMIGLPGETEEDIIAIADLAARVKAEGRRAGSGGEVNVSVSTFVPKPNTPFQWEPQISLEEIHAKHTLLHRELKKRKLNFKWHDPGLSFMEGVFARGDRRLGKVLLHAHLQGCAFDGWGEHFRMDRWLTAFETAGIDPEFYHRRRRINEILPWDHLDCGVNHNFLLQEHERSATGIYTPDCRNGICSGCGICDFQELRMRVTPSRDIPAKAMTQAHVDGVRRIRLRYSKTGSMRFLSHLEVISVVSRAVSRAGIPIRFSQGFHPHPKFSFATALSVGVESYAEYMDMEIEPSMGAKEVCDRLNSSLPTGMYVMESWEIHPKATSLSVIMEQTRYRVILPDSGPADLAERATRFLSLDSFPWSREKKRGAIDLDLRKELTELTVENNSFLMLVKRGKPLEFAAAVLGVLPADLKEACIEKLEVTFMDDESSLLPTQDAVS